MAEYEIPKDLQYTREDEWVRVDDDQIMIGVTDYAQQQLGDIVFVELPEIGSKLIRGESFGVIESVKAVSDLYAPISGTVIAINGDLEDRPEIVNESCYADGWLLTITDADEAELEALLDPNTYQQFVEDRTE